MNDGINNRYTIEINVLTPINIGSGAEKDWVKGADFVIDNYKLYKLNLKKIIAEGVDPHKLASIFEQRDKKSIITLIPGKLEKVSDASYECPLNDISNDVKTFIRNQLTGNPIVPGSSLKGAIRSALLEYLIPTKERSKRPLQLKEENYFGSTTKGDEFLRFIKISDAEFKQTKLLNSKIFNLYQDGYDYKGGWKHADGRNSSTDSKFKPTGFNTLYEVIDRGQKGYCDIMLSQHLFQQVICKDPRSVINNNLTKQALDIQSLFSIINKHTSQHIKKEIAFYKKYSNSETQQIIDCLEGVSKHTTLSSSCVIKMSAGSGFHSITGDWQFDDYSINKIATINNRTRGMKDGDKSAKSRKIIIDGEKFMPMGFVQLRLLSKEEVSQREEILSKERQEYAERIRIERERAEIAAKAEQQRLIEEKEKRESFEQLISEIIANMSKVNLAQELIIKAESLIPDDSRLSDLKQQLQEQLNKIQFEKLTQEIAQADAAKNMCSLAERLSKVTNIKTAIGNVKSWLKTNSKNALSEQDMLELKDALSRIFSNLSLRDQKKLSGYNNWKELENYIGQAKGLSWYSDITGNAI